MTPIDDDALIDSAAETTEGAPAVTHAAELPTIPLLPAGATRTLWGDAWRRLRKNKLAVVALCYLAVVIIAATTADLWVPRAFGDPIAIDTTTVVADRLQDPSLAHPMGTDDLGRDILSRVIYGARVSLTVGFIAMAISVVLGIVLGSVSGYYGGYADGLVMRLADVFLAFPYVLFAILLISVLGRGVASVFIALGILGWTTIARVIRASILSVKENDYVDAARALGAGDVRIMARHILPNAIAPIIVYATMSIGAAILAEAALSFLGLGVQPPTPSWGRMLEEARTYMTSHPALMFWPGFAILTTVLAFVLLGDGLRDALDVKLKE